MDSDRSKPQVVIDTNVWVAALRSQDGASWRLTKQVGVEYDMHISNALCLEYEQTFRDQREAADMTEDEIEDLMRHICTVSVQHRRHFFRWRGFSPDPGDDHILELAIKAGVDQVITFNTKDLAPARSFGIEVVTPGEFLQQNPQIS